MAKENVVGKKSSIGASGGEQTETVEWIHRPMEISLAGSEYRRGESSEPWLPHTAKLYSPSFMVETNGAGRVEAVPGFDPARTYTVGLPGAIPSLRNPGPTPETVFDDDRRRPVVVTETVPWRSICNLAIQYQTGRSHGTAWFVGPGLLMTAGHCIYDHQHGGGYANDIIIYPGRNGAASVGMVVRAAGVWVHPGWPQTANPELDYGFLSINETALGQHLGYFGFVDVADAVVANTIVNVAGYPYDKSEGTLWFDSGRIAGQDKHFLYYALDTEPGNSGGPVFWYGQNQERIVFAIHTYSGAVANRGRRITAEIFDKIVELRGF